MFAVLRRDEGSNTEVRMFSNSTMAPGVGRPLRSVTVPCTERFQIQPTSPEGGRNRGLAAAGDFLPSHCREWFIDFPADTIVGP